MGDTDNDGIPNYLDNLSESHLAPLSSEQTTVVTTATGLSISLGHIAQAANGKDASGLSITRQDIAEFGGENSEATALAADDAFAAITAIIDFEIHQLEKPGLTVPIVIPMPEGNVLPNNAVYRKFSSESGWYTMIADADNRIASASKDSNGLCPVYSSDKYTDGLNQGDACILIELTDGGIYDDDGYANGSIADPGVIAVANLPPEFSIVESMLSNEGESVNVELTSVSDPEGDSLSYEWQQVAGQTVSLTSDINSSQLAFIAPEIADDETLVFEVSVSDGRSTVTKSVSVNLVNIPAIVTAVGTVSGTLINNQYQTNTQVTLSGAGSSDSKNSPLSYQWQQISGPSVSLSGVADAQATFVVPSVTQATTLIFALTVNNNETHELASNTVQVSVPLQVISTSTPVENNEPVGGGGTMLPLLMGMMLAFGRRQTAQVKKK